MMDDVSSGHTYYAVPGGLTSPRRSNISPPGFLVEDFDDYSGRLNTQQDTLEADHFLDD